MKEETKTLIERALAYARESIADGSRFAHGVHVYADGGVSIYAIDNDFMSSWQKKNQIGIMILTALAEKGGTFVVCADAWRASAKARNQLPKNFGDLPPDQREECLLAWANAPGEMGVTINQSYKRDAQGKPQWGAVEYITENLMSSRWAYDLRTKHPHDVLLEAALRTREGVSGIQ